MENILSTDNISKSYGPVKALNNLTFEVPKGAIFGILGPNGSGKTTTLSILLDVLKADSGHYSWFNNSTDKHYRKKIGTLLETPNFYHYLSAFDNLKITQAISSRGNKTEIDAVLETVRLQSRKNDKFSTYSLGMKQRLAIAAALLGNPDVLVLDEPTNGLDPVGIAEIRTLIIELGQQGKTIIMASHLLDEVEKVCTHFCILKQGNLLVNGPVKEILSNEDVIILRSSDLNQLKQVLLSIPGYTHLTEEKDFCQIHCSANAILPEDINAHCYNKGVILSHLEVKKKSLEEKFFELTGN
ncbi:MAG: ATP-binding cassette domain-containing protein [Sphingobacteriales bacterium]|uniref:ABC transporter ATP-binding protein n=1 Tax=Hydrotalea flava TaxID=714549 RepID=UPI00082E0502|nr:ABC transporter ATP-binding protein [Hydrotalea flava]RTL55102.1 MAG: ATP-binding cassette domain-containing protein [Sphingobacteriales bacterium]